MTNITKITIEPTVTLPLEEYEELQDTIENLQEQIKELNREVSTWAGYLPDLMYVTKTTPGGIKYSCLEKKGEN